MLFVSLCSLINYYIWLVDHQAVKLIVVKMDPKVKCNAKFRGT